MNRTLFEEWDADFGATKPQTPAARPIRHPCRACQRVYERRIEDEFQICPECLFAAAETRDVLTRELAAWLERGEQATEEWVKRQATLPEVYAQRWRALCAARALATNASAAEAFRKRLADTLADPYNPMNELLEEERRTNEILHEATRQLRRIREALAQLNEAEPVKVAASRQYR